MALEIDFDKVAHDFDHGRVNVYAEDGGQRVFCGISDEALQDMTGGSSFDPDELISIAQENADILGRLISEKYDNGLLEPDGYVIIKSSDL